MAHRYLSKDGTLASQTTYPITHESSVGPYVRQHTIIADPRGVGQKYWAFATSGLAMGLVTEYQGQQLPGPTVLTQNNFTWTQDVNGNSYISSAQTTWNPGGAQSTKSQTVDIYGNVTQVVDQNFANLTPARTYNYSYLNSSNYTSLYIPQRHRALHLTWIQLA